MFPFILAAIGFLMIFLEFYLPGGLMGVLGGLSLLVALILFAMEYESPFLIILFFIAIVGGIFLVFKFALWKMRYGQKGTGIYSEGDQEGFVASSFDHSAIGKKGIVSSDLKPGGHILIEGKKHLAISQSGYLSQGENVIVTGGEGESLLVKREKECSTC